VTAIDIAILARAQSRKDYLTFTLLTAGPISTGTFRGIDRREFLVPQQNISENRSWRQD